MLQIEDQDTFNFQTSKNLLSNRPNSYTSNDLVQNIYMKCGLTHTKV